MTMPHLMNCPHKGGTWCLKCVGEEWDRREAERDAMSASIAELEEAAAGDAKVAAEAVQRIAELERKAAAVDGFLAAIQKPFTEDDLKQIEEARLVERKSKAFDAIAQAWVENRFSLTVGANNDDGFVDIDSLEPTDNPETLLTAIEAATAAKETPNG